MLPQSSWAADIALILLPFLIAFLSKLAASSAVYISDSKLNDDAQNGNKKAETVMELLKNNSDIELSVRLLSILCMAISGTAVFSVVKENFLITQNANTVNLITLCFIVIFPWFFWGLSFESPKALSAYAPDKFAYALTLFIKIAVVITVPARFICKWLSCAVILFSGNNPKETPHFVTEEEIRMLVDEGEEKGTIENIERRMINNVFEFDNHDIAEVMTHRTEVAAVPVAAHLHEVINLSIETGYSRIAVYEDDIDNICGFVYIKDLLKYIFAQDDSKFSLKKEIRKPIYLPESCSCSDAFSIFKKNKTQIAVVVDEYGGTYGIVTMEDLLETIFGNIQDEYDQEKTTITDLGNGNYLLDGSVNIPDLEQFFDTMLPDEFESDTVGGLVTEVLGHVPNEGEAVEEILIGEIAFKVVECDDRKITKLSARKISQDDDD